MDFVYSSHRNSSVVDGNSMTFLQTETAQWKTITTVVAHVNRKKNLWNFLNKKIQSISTIVSFLHYSDNCFDAPWWQEAHYEKWIKNCAETTRFFVNFSTLCCVVHSTMFCHNVYEWSVSTAITMKIQWRTSGKLCSLDSAYVIVWLHHE